MMFYFFLKIVKIFYRQTTTIYYVVILENVDVDYVIVLQLTMEHIVNVTTNHVADSFQLENYLTVCYMEKFTRRCDVCWNCEFLQRQHFVVPLPDLKYIWQHHLNFLKSHRPLGQIGFIK